MFIPASTHCRASRSTDLIEYQPCRLFALSCKSLQELAEISPAGRKKKMDGISSDLAARYLGMHVLDNCKARLVAAQMYSPEKAETEAMKKLILHREILFFYSMELDTCRVHPEYAVERIPVLQSYVDAAEAENKPTGRKIIAKLKRQIQQANDDGLRIEELLPTLKLYTKHFKAQRKNVERLVAIFQACVNSPKRNLEQLLNHLQEHIGRLSETEAPDVLSDANGRRFFCIPGGVADTEDGHLISYEFAREADGTYSFIIYNKGEGSNDRELHGEVAFSKGGLQIGRSRVQIGGLKKGDLQDRRFLKMLLEKSVVIGNTMEDLYLEIKSYLLHTCNGVVREAPEERKWLALNRAKRLSSEKMMSKAEIEEMLLKDPDFHRMQAWGTCYESNLQTPEHFIIPSQLRKKLKLHDIQVTMRLIGSEIKRHPELAELARSKIQKLQSKIL